jgi:hypothetical protein
MIDLAIELEEWYNDLMEDEELDPHDPDDEYMFGDEDRWGDSDEQ